MVKVRHKPLFNRRYLLILMWVLPIVIVILHRSGQPSGKLDRISWQSGQHYQLPLQGDPPVLTLILPSQPSLSDAGWISGQAVERALQTKLSEPALQQWLKEQQWQARLVVSSAFLALEFQLPSPPTPTQQKTLLAQLAQPPQIDWSALEKRLQAERYLQRQSAESGLLAAFGERLSSAVEPRSAYAQLWRTPPRWTLSGEIDSESSSAGPMQAKPSDRSGWHPGQLTLNPENAARLDTGWELIAQPIPAPEDGRTMARQRLGAELVSHLLAKVVPSGSDYRWLWQPLAAGGYQGLLLHNWPAPSGSITERLAGQLDQPLLDSIRDTLLNQLRRIEEGDPQQWLNLVALYRFPLDSHKAFRDTLAALSLDEARQIVADTLRSEQSLHIRFDTTGH